MVVVAIGAHPDDIEFGCYGTLAQLSKDHEIKIIVLTCGEVGGPKEKRVDECLKSAEIIGADIKIIGYPDGNIPITAESVTNLKELIEKNHPETIFTLYPYDTHQDHRNATQLTFSSCPRIKQILCYEVPSSQGFQPNVWYDVTENYETKLKALQCHTSQRGKPQLDLEAIKSLAKFRAWQCGWNGQLAEAFHLHRLMVPSPIPRAIKEVGVDGVQGDLLSDICEYHDKEDSN